MTDITLHKPDDMTNSTIYICTSADNNFIIPLNVMLVSLFAHLDQPKNIVIYILSDGIFTSNRNKVLKSVKAKNADIRFVNISERERSYFKDVIVRNHVSKAAYYRLLIPSLLSKNINKIIYLDPDCIINTDIGKLWDIDVGDNYLLAVQEQGSNCLYVSSRWGVQNYKMLALDPKSKNFNSGVMVLNITKWREDKMSQKIIEYLIDNRQNMRLNDQEGFNAILAGKWGELDHRWNLLSQIFSNSTWQEGPVQDIKIYKELVEHPYIIHFNTGNKPWKFGCWHPYTNLFLKYLVKTPWYWPCKVRLYQGRISMLLKNIWPMLIKRVINKIGMFLFSK